MCRPTERGCKFNFVPAPGFHCGLERDTQRQLWRFMDPHSVVLEVGARFGTVSCAISKRQRYSGLRVSLEPDLWALRHWLRTNADNNRCNGTQVFGVLSNSRASLPTRGGYHILAGSASNGSIPGRSVPWLQRQLANHAGLVSPPNFTVLFVDCEGCAFDLVSEQAEFIRGVETIFLEADGNHEHLGWGGLWRRYTSELFPRLCDLGLAVVDVEPNLTCCPGLFHVVFQRGNDRCRLQDKGA